MPRARESQTTSKQSKKRSSGSKKRWRQPRNAREFAAQANEVATMILNGEMNIDDARAYASVARVVAQSMSSSVTQARFLKEAPDLSLEWDEEKS